MTKQEKVKQIVEKYDISLSQLISNVTAKEVKTVFKFFVDESNRKQRELVGLKTNQKHVYAQQRIHI